MEIKYGRVAGRVKKIIRIDKKSHQVYWNYYFLEDYLFKIKIATKLGLFPMVAICVAFPAFWQVVVFGNAEQMFTNAET